MKSDFDNKSFRGTANTDGERQRHGGSSGGHSRRRKKPKTGFRLPSLGRLRHSLGRSVPDLILIGLFLPFLAFLVFGWDELASHAPHMLAILAAFIALIGLLRRAYWAAGVWAFSGLLLLAPMVSAALRAPPFPVAGCHFTALTFNTKLSRVPDEAGVAAVVAGTHADLVFLQEVTDPISLETQIRARLSVSDYTSVQAGQGGRVILSRFPLQTGKVDAIIDYAVAEIASKKVHLATAIAPKMLIDVDGVDDFEQALDLLDREATGPFLFGGDLNAGPYSPLPQNLRVELEDAYLDVGKGLGLTFPTSSRTLGVFGPFVRLDYLLTNSQITPVAAKVLQDRASSTHLPVWGEFVLKNAGENGKPCR